MFNFFVVIHLVLCFACHFLWVRLDTTEQVLVCRHLWECSSFLLPDCPLPPKYLLVCEYCIVLRTRHGHIIALSWMVGVISTGSEYFWLKSSSNSETSLFFFLSCSPHPIRCSSAPWLFPRSNCKTQIFTGLSGFTIFSMHSILWKTWMGTIREFGTWPINQGPFFNLTNQW